MFKGRAMQVRMVREDPQDSTPYRSEWTPNAVSILISEQIQTLLIMGATVYVVKATADTVSKVVLKTLNF